jgi:ATP-binding cassette subfamily F protein uup
LTVTGGALAFGHVPLLDHADLQIDAGERLALIGRNGTGKSSLLRILAGAAGLDDGKCWLAPGSRVSLVPQEPAFEPKQRVYDAIAGGLGSIAAALIAYHDRSAALSGTASKHDLDELNALQAELEHGDGWRMNTRIEQTLTALSLDGNATVDTLSGGTMKRVAIGRAIVAEPHLLLLDEPTNHLDLDGILWLEDLLLGFGGAVVVVTHDRRFLDRVATRIVELDRGSLRSYPGRFADYQRRKEQELAAESQANARFDKLLAQEEVWIRKGIEARRTRNEGRVRRLAQLRIERAARRERLGRVELALDRGELSGKLVAELNHVSKGFGSPSDHSVVVGDFSCRILRGDKVGIIGPNGSGKTTLLKLILGELKPDAGQVRLGSRLEVAYFDQFRTQLDPDATLASVISPGSEFIEISGRRQHVIGYLGDFLFSPERARSRVDSLSGGERNRLLLARLFARPANVVVLDEPTNDLDIETLELLETLLEEYPGTVLLVSHDRAFLDAVVTQTIAYEGNARWQEYAGGYDDWLRVRRAEPRPESDKNPPKPKTAKPARERVDTLRRLTFNEQRELDGLPARIDALEQAQKTLVERLADPALYQRTPQDVAGVQERLARVQQELDTALARWETLAARAQ